VGELRSVALVGRSFGASAAWSRLSRACERASDPLRSSSQYGKLNALRIISKRQLRDFVARYPKAADPLKHWVNVVESSSWKTPAETKASFRSADMVGDRTVFDIGGNNYRLVSFVHYRAQIVYIKRVLTHAEYDRGDWKQ
jgi:mRNA interferase HigB